MKRDIKTTDIINRISDFSIPFAFIAKDFLDISDYETARKALNRLSDKGYIRKITNGIYYKPYYSEVLDTYEAPSPHYTALAIARKFNWTIAPTGATALNLLGLSTQVPAKWSYISDGPYHNYTIENIDIEFKRRKNREITGMSPKTVLIIQAFLALGKENIDSSILRKIKDSLTTDELSTLVEETRKTTNWIGKIISETYGDKINA